MRLTLRTLLAYLDDVLAPEATKDIGQKIQESQMAQLLVSRIREVMRRRRLKAPDVIGPEIGVDPNIIAQYLDNTLPANQYADVERVLLASDELLAETASCHQVLALALGDTSELPVAMRERLYALGPVAAGAQLAIATDTDLELKSRTPLSISTKDVPLKSRKSSAEIRTVDRPAPVVPDYLKPAPIWKRALPSILILMLVAVCVALTVPAVQMAMQQANHELQRKVTRNTPSQRSMDDAQVQEQPAPTAEVADPNAAVPAMASGDVSGDTVAIDENKLPSPATSGEAMGQETPPRVATSKPVKPGAVIPEVNVPEPSPATEPGSTKESGRPPLPGEILAELGVVYNSTEGILIRRAVAKQHWFVVPYRFEIQPDERIASLEPFEARLDFDKSGVRATLVGEVVLELLRPNPAGALQGINVGRGRILLQPRTKSPDETSVIAIAIGEDVWKLQMLTASTVCGLEVRVELPYQLDKPSDSRWYQAALYVMSGEVQWTNRAGKTIEITAQNGLEIVSEKVGSDAVPVPLVVVPDWCDPAKRPAQQQVLKKIQSNFEKMFDVDQPVDESMITVVANEKNPKIAALATHCLSAMDNHAALVQVLATCNHEEARFAARDGLRQWLPINPVNGEKLKQALQTHYQDAEAEDVYQLLWGFSRDDVKASLSKSLQFTAWMMSPKREIRELAEFWVKQLTGRQIDYKALNPPANRDAQVRRLEDQIKRNNGLIKGP